MSTLALRNPTFEKDLTDDARADLDYWRNLLKPAMTQATRGVDRTLRSIAAATGQPYKTVKKRFYRWKKFGLQGLVDKRLAGPSFWRVRRRHAAPQVALCRGIQELWRSLCEQNQRKSKPEYQTLVKLWRNRDARIQQIPEYQDFPGWPELPAGWDYSNLMRYGPTPFELEAARTGRAAAALKRPTVLGTRADCWVGSHYLFDDKWNDLFVNSFADRQAGRPLEVYALDYFSAYKVANAVRVRTRDQEGNYQGIAGVMMRYVLAATLHGRGYSTRGTTLVAEHGTAAVSDAIAQILFDGTGGKIVLSESGMSGAISHLGQYPGLRRGNPRHKAALESNNNLEHNRRGALPGQTGRSVATRPEQLDGLLKYNDRLLAALDKLPADKAAMLDWPLLELNQYLSLADHIDAEIALDRAHDLEGWIEAGNVVQAIQLGGKSIIETELTPDQRANLPALIESGLIQAEPVRMSRREVWERGAGELVPLPGWGVCAILGDDLAREVTVRNGQIAIADKEWLTSETVYDSFFRDADGCAGKLAEGEKYQAFVNPFALGTLFVRDARGRYVGECRLISRAGRQDVEAVRRAMGEAAARESALLLPQQIRQLGAAKRKQDRHDHNAAVLADHVDAPAGSEKRRAADARNILLGRESADEDGEG